MNERVQIPHSIIRLNQKNKSMTRLRSSELQIPTEDRYSVIISSTGRAEYLRELLISLEIQAIKPAQVIILLDKNTVGEECCRNLEGLELEMHIEIWQLEGMNLPAKRNLGARMASSDIIMYSDDDDIWSSEKSVVMLGAIKKGWRVACHNYGVFGSEAKLSCSRLGEKTITIGKRSLLTGDNVYGGGSSITSIRSLVLAIPFDETLDSCEDLDWWIRVLLSGTDIYYSADSLVNYRRHKTNMGKDSWLMAKTQGKVAARNLATACMLAAGSLMMLVKSATRPLR